MRTVLKSQMSLGEMAIGKIKLNPKSRDDIPSILAGLQYIDTTSALQDAVFTVLQPVIPQQTKKEKREVPS